MVIAVPPNSIRAQYPDVRTLNKSGWLGRPAGACFWFGATLNRALGIPIGLINRAVSGSWIARWLGNTIASDPDPDVQALLSNSPGWGDLYRRKIAPLEPYAIRGVAWWQGEKDVRHPAYYRHMLPALIRSWRGEWGEGDFPFLFVQLPTGGGLKGDESPATLPNIPATRDHAPPMRDAYIQALSEPNTGLVISTDLDGGMHPRDKQDYGQRFAMVALGTVYGHSMTFSGPVYESMQVQGDTVRIHFRQNTANTLLALGGGDLQGFEVAGADGPFVWAQAEIVGSEVLVSSPDVPAPVSVRYAWADSPKWANLFNGDLLAAAPFSTEHPPIAVPPTTGPTATYTPSTPGATQVPTPTPTSSNTPTVTATRAPTATSTPTPARTSTPLPGCGNGQVDPGEECDDGNRVSGDGCTANCRVEIDALIPGRGGDSCLHEWLPIPLSTQGLGGLPVNRVDCADGDPSCDFDGSGDGTCTFHVAQCFNVVDPRLTCTTTDVRRVQVIIPASGHSGSVDEQNRMNLSRALDPLGGHVQGSCVNPGPQRGEFCVQSSDCDSHPGSGNGICFNTVVLSPSLTATNVCSSYAEIKVRVRQTARGAFSGSRFLKVTTVSNMTRGAHAIKDTDTLKLTCRPAR
jgi:cysteine-rich repeat protein